MLPDYLDVAARLLEYIDLNENRLRACSIFVDRSIKMVADKCRSLTCSTMTHLMPATTMQRAYDELMWWLQFYEASVSSWETGLEWELSFLLAGSEELSHDILVQVVREWRTTAEHSHILAEKAEMLDELCREDVTTDSGLKSRAAKTVRHPAEDLTVKAESFDEQVFDEAKEALAALYGVPTEKLFG